MNAGAIARLALGALVIGDLLLANENPVAMRQDSMLHVHVYNFAQVHSRTLDRALDEAARILAAAGVQTVWELGETDAPEGHTVELAANTVAAHQTPDERPFLVARIVRGLPAICLPGTLGFALPPAQHGVHVTIFYDRIEVVAQTVPPDIAKILGNALAHEIGHVLLGSERHSRSGIMKAVWIRADYEHLAARPLEFLPAEAVTVREAVTRRAAVRKDR